MSYTKAVRDALLGGKAMSIKELVDSTGLSIEQVKFTLAELRRSGRAQSFPVVYSLTELGESGKRRRPVRKPGGRKSVETPEPTEGRGEREVRRALSHRHPLDQCWGVGA